MCLERRNSGQRAPASSMSLFCACCTTLVRWLIYCIASAGSGGSGSGGGGAAAAVAGAVAGAVVNANHPLV
jgi:hypothetical protein